MSTGRELFQKNARAALRDMNMVGAALEYGATVEVLRKCLLLRKRPRGHQQEFLETHAPAILAYLEKIGSAGDDAAWRTVEARIHERFTGLCERHEFEPCKRPHLLAIFHTLPEFQALGMLVLGRVHGGLVPAADLALNATAENSGDGQGDSGKGGKAGASTAMRPRLLPARRFYLPVVAVEPTPAENRFLELEDEKEEESEVAAPAPRTGTGGPKGLGGPNQ